MSTISDSVPIRTSSDVVLVRNAVRLAAERMGFRHIDVTKLVTAASEIARNTLVYGGGGVANVECCEEGVRSCVRLVFEDHGPGIPDLPLALREGYTSGGGMGLGLSGSKRLVDRFDIDSEVGRGTRVTMLKCR
ncbi:MAG TPA: anti-sigma regulatory factor [Thermoanaerobaculia bacterium]|jgi:serine/threonine-protein kinase RsbT|nr:anti-sigma regulatory factor [Thermoanaerobaculia bacterium]